MKIAIALLPALLAAPVFATNDEERLREHPPLPADEQSVLDVLDYPVLATPGNCTDTIRQVRQERGLPQLDRRAADPDEPILFRALDYDVDGCDVLLVNDRDIRPLPAPQEGPLLQRAQ